MMPIQFHPVPFTGHSHPSKLVYVLPDDELPEIYIRDVRATKI